MITIVSRIPSHSVSVKKNTVFKRRKTIQKKEKWYKNGLKFGCTGCGSCCTGTGYVFVKRKDALSISDHLNIPLTQFYDEYTHMDEDDIVLNNNEDNTQCVFLDENKSCTVYESRPIQCRTYPFWEEVIRSPNAWHLEKRECEGIEHEEGRLFSLEEIEERVKRE
eukprot:TRINITY_DN2257_c0_g1_i2.p1 TRINITY_DN2257_c0_g1~~TRINITY_DN2257_c0_g1_i2.p1  ORF type:complete len:165 (+),score=29.71 TRINITY_DN2257_c0_g1_i2:113-607(+)